MRRSLLLLLLASLTTGCLFTDDDGIDFDESTTIDDERFAASCAVVRGPVVLPAERARLDAAIGDNDCLRVDGNLTVRGDVDSLGKFEELEQVRVSGRLVVSVNSGMADLSRLRGVTHVETDLVVELCDGLISTEGLLRLQHVGGDFRVGQNDDLRLVHGPKSLRQIGADLIVEDNPIVCDMTGFDGLEYIAEYDSADDRPIGAGDFGGGDPTTRPEIVDPHIIVTDNPQLKTIDGFSVLTDIDGDIRLERNDELTAVRGFEQLEFMTGRLVIRDQPFLEKIDAMVRPSCLREVILENTAVTDLTAFSEVSEIGRLELVGNEGLAGLGGLSEDLRLRGPVVIAGNPALRSTRGLGGVTSIDHDRDSRRELPSAYAETPNALCVDTGLSADPSELTIEDNDALEELGLIALERVSGEVTIRGNDILTDLSGIANLRRVFGDLTIEQNGALQQVSGFNEMESLFGSIYIVGNPALVRFDGLRGLESIDGDLVIEENAALESIDGFRSLSEVEELTLRANGVTDLDGFAALRSAEHVEIVDHPNLVQLVDFVSLRDVDNELRIERNAMLSELDMPQLSGVDGLVVQNNPSLPECEAQDLVDQVFGLSYALIEDNASCE